MEQRGIAPAIGLGILGLSTSALAYVGRCFYASELTARCSSSVSPLLWPNLEERIADCARENFPQYVIDRAREAPCSVIDYSASYFFPKSMLIGLGVFALAVVVSCLPRRPHRSHSD